MILSHFNHLPSQIPPITIVQWIKSELTKAYETQHYLATGCLSTSLSAPPPPCSRSLCDLVFLPPWTCHAGSCPELLYLVSPILVMPDPEDKAEFLSADQLSSRSLPSLTASTQGGCSVLLGAALPLTSLTALSQLCLCLMVQIKQSALDLDIQIHQSAQCYNHGYLPLLTPR